MCRTVRRCQDQPHGESRDSALVDLDGGQVFGDVHEGIDETYPVLPSKVYFIKDLASIVARRCVVMIGESDDLNGIGELL